MPLVVLSALGVDAVLYLLTLLSSHNEAWSFTQLLLRQVRKVAHASLTI